MALVNGSDYDHIDLHSVAGGDVTRHMLKDAQARQDVTGLKSAIKNTNAVYRAGLAQTVGGTTFDQGELSVQSASTISTSTAIRSHNTINSSYIGVKAPDGIEFSVFAFDASNNYVGRYTTNDGFSKSVDSAITTAWFNDLVFGELTREAYAYKIVARYANGGDILPSAAADFVYYSHTDKTLSQPNKSADADAVGQIINTMADTVDVLSGEKNLVSSANEFTDTTLYTMDGGTATNSSYRATDYIECDLFSFLKYKLCGTTSISPAMAIIAFFTSGKSFITAVPAVLNNSIVESAVPVPSTAKYFKAAYLISSSNAPYVIGVYKDNSIGQLAEDVVQIAAQITAVDFEAVFDDPVCYLNNGDITSGGNSSAKRRMSRRIDCAGFDEIAYQLVGISSQRMLVFWDTDLSAISYISGSGTNAWIEGTASVPAGAKYVSGAWLSSATAKTPYIRGVRYDAVKTDLSNQGLITGATVPTAGIAQIINAGMTLAEFRDAFNAGLDDYAMLCKIDRISFRSLTTSDNTWDKVYAKINKNFRREVYIPGITHKCICDRINYAFTVPIWQFMDAKLNTGAARDFSLKFPNRSGEPSLIVSEDGGTLYCYSIYSATRYATTDGILWDNGTALTFDSVFRPEHGNVNLIEGVYYLIAPDNNANSAGRNLRLWTSTDGINFTYQGIPIATGHDFGNGVGVTIWGNSYLIKDGGTFYFYIEAYHNTTFWQIYLVTCTDILYDNGDGTIGNWVNNAMNPVLGGDPFPESSNTDAAGNPDFYKGPDNRPLRIDGKWMMLYHVTHNGASYIFRAYSEDLRTWTIENKLINNRDVPTAGEASAGNADHAIIGFKGRTYLFYTWDINSVNTPYIKYLIDDRPILEMMRVMA